MTDPVVATYNQIASLLMAEPSLYDPNGKTNGLIWPGNFIQFSGTLPYREKINKNDGDFPELVLDEEGFADTAYTKWPTFGSVRQGGSNWREQLTQVFSVSITVRDLRLEPCAQLRNAVALALRKGGPKLGLQDFVHSWGPLSGTAPAKGTEAQTGSRARRNLKILIPVNFMFNGNDIIT